ncbi:hypothetical protein CKM354_001008800 [Cercospora kikuchii]|uniref:F-box domain-containing protein n=1 Tax=Cercospora kikuchii TaxID=84275 RepID=A0A9P3CQV0_9PEZI|nr:uncharacterized protein CKM354_001008800 [Cercospora kikuchii]GIZ46986.1 hypothetical protein CKM354_001008800 [Cercospora kikuchii]
MASFNGKEPTAPLLVPASANDLAGGDSSVPLNLIIELPVEMQLRILSYLPAKEIQRFRRVSRHFRDTIDLKGNQCLLIAPGVAQSMHRFNTFIKRYCEFPMESEDGGPDAFLDAIFDFITLRQVEVWDLDLDEFSAFWLERSLHLDGSSFPGCEIETLTDNFWHVWRYASDQDPSRPAWNIFDDIYGDKSKTLLTRVKTFVRGDYNSESADSDAGVPARKSNFTYTQIKEREDEMERLHRVLQLPVLPSISPYAYYNYDSPNHGSSSWAKERLEDAMVRNEEIRGIERAALMEELYIA